jgi:PKD repeat protein
MHVRGAHAGYETDFADNSQQGDDPITTWLWNFGDGR